MLKPKAGIWILLLLMVLIGACSKLCELGYEGKHCNDLVIDNYTGQWLVLDSNSHTIDTASVVPGNGILNVLISKGFTGHAFTNAVSAAASNNILTIDSQQPDNNGFYIAGRGQIFNGGSNIAWFFNLGNDRDSTVLRTFQSETWSR